MTEVFFPNRFTVDEHSGKAPDMFPNYPEELNGISVPIEYLTHVTHDKEASEICPDEDGPFEFNALITMTMSWLILIHCNSNHLNFKPTVLSERMDVLKTLLRLLISTQGTLSRGLPRRLSVRTAMKT